MNLGDTAVLFRNFAQGLGSPRGIDGTVLWLMAFFAPALTLAHRLLAALEIFSACDSAKQKQARRDVIEYFKEINGRPCECAVPALGDMSCDMPPAS